jgi:hypothetical protein
VDPVTAIAEAITAVAQGWLAWFNALSPDKRTAIADSQVEFWVSVQNALKGLNK